MIIATPNPTPTPTSTPTAAPQLSILFTDTTLVPGVVGRSYLDYVGAKTFSGTTFTDVKVSYAMTGDLPDGLNLSGTTGYISGIITKSATPGAYKVMVSAFAKGYPTQIFPYEFNLRIDGASNVVAPTPTPTPKSTTKPSSSTSTSSGKATLMATVWFDLGKSLLTPSTKALLNNMIADLKESTFTKIQVRGFTDGVKGVPDSKLSLARANAVRKYILAATKGISVSVVGLSLAPASANSTKNMQISRKAELWVS